MESSFHPLFDLGKKICLWMQKADTLACQKVVAPFFLGRRSSSVVVAQL